MKHYWSWFLFSCVVIAATNYMLGLDLGHLAGFYIGVPLSLACLWIWLRLFGS
jgi:hypothetical protein